MNRLCVETAVRYSKNTTLILSGAYSNEIAEKELKLRQQAAISCGANPKDILDIPGVTDTRDELTKLGIALTGLGATSVLLVSDQYHMPRFVLWAKKILPPEIQIFHVSTKTTRYERTCEPSKIKSIRAGNKMLWVMWNMLMYTLSPIITSRPRVAQNT